MYQEPVRHTRRMTGCRIRLDHSELGREVARRIVVCDLNAAWWGSCAGSVREVWRGGLMVGWWRTKAHVSLSDLANMSGGLGGRSRPRK